MAMSFFYTGGFLGLCVGIPIGAVISEYRRGKYEAKRAWNGRRAYRGK